MGVLYAPSSGYARERAKWEATHTEFGPPGRPYDPNPRYPAMLYKAWRTPSGKIEIKERQIVQDEHEQRNFESRGFVAGGPGEAVKAWEAQETEIATLAASREWDLQHGRHSVNAVAEVRAAEAEAGAKHLAEIPALPIKPRKPGRPKKTEARHGGI